jgi:multicomponent Na+:H+ antiporter subunit F
MPADTSIVVIASRFALVVLLISIALALVRLIKGPDAADRIVALDLISMLIVAFLAAESIYAGETSFLDVAIAYALIAFLGTVALARFLMRSAQKT